MTEISVMLDDKNDEETDMQKTNSQPRTQVFETYQVTSQFKEFDEKEVRSTSSSRRNSKEESPEPIVEVKHTSSSSSSSSNSYRRGSHSHSSSSGSSDCEGTTKLVRRRTIRRYHRATEEHEEPTERSTGNKLIISIDRAPEQVKDSKKGTEEIARSHYRTRQIGTYYGQAHQRQQQQTKTSSSTSTSKIATITTNRKSTTSHRSELISKSSSGLPKSTENKECDKESGNLPLTPNTMLRDSRLQDVIERRLNNKTFDDDLFETTKSIKVQEEEQSSSVRQSFSETTSIREVNGRMREAAISSAGEAASLVSKRHANIGNMSADLSAETSSRHFKTSSSVIVSGGDASGAYATNPTRKLSQSCSNDSTRPFLQSETIFSSPDVRSLVKEIGTDFAELENALSSTSTLSQANSSNSLSMRLFGRRLLSPISGSSYPAVSNSSSGHSLLEEPSSQLLESRINSYLGGNTNEMIVDSGQSTGDKIKELIDRAQSSTQDRPIRPNVLSLDIQKPDSRLKQRSQSDLKIPNEKLAEKEDKLHQSHCKAVMCVSIERIEQRMSDLCKKLNESCDTKEAIDLLKIMIQMIEKAWSVPVCGDDLGFKLCNSLREAGGLDIILGFISDSDDRNISLSSDYEDAWRSSLMTGFGDKQVQEFDQDEPKDASLNSNKPLKLNLSKLNYPATNGPKDSDSDIITSDLGLDSTSVESLSYVSAAQIAPAQNEDLENEVTIETGSETLDEEEAILRKDELVFLSARLLSQCLTSKNRDYIVENGLRPVIRLACNFTTMKSNQKRLLLRSMLLRQSSTVGASKQVMQESHDNIQTTNPEQVNQTGKQKELVTCNTGDNHDQTISDIHAIIGTEILQHLFKHSEDTCSKMISLGALRAILYGCRSTNIEILRHCASALANLALYGGPDSQQTMIEQKAHVWLFPLAFNEDDNIQYYACLAIVVLVANQEIEADVLKSTTLDLVEPFVTCHEPQKFAESTTSHIHGQSANWLRKLIPLLESKREEARNLACFHFAMEAYIKREQGQTQVFKEIEAVEPLRKVGSSPIAIASKLACQALRLIGEKEPHKLSQQVPLWTSEDVVEWVSQIGFEKFKSAFVESRVDGDLLLQLDEDTLRTDIGIENGIIRRRFLRELSNLKRIADYSSVDKSGLSSLFGLDFVQYIYPMLQLGVTKDNIHLLDSEQLLMECKIANTVHRMKLAHAIKNLQEKLAMFATSNECSSIDGNDQKTLDVFVSYRRSTGSQLASLLKVHLQLRGFSVFIDVERLEAGKFDNNLLDSIKTAKNFILVLSPNALDRCIGDHECKDWVHKEIVAALASNCNIIPIMDNNFHWPDADQLPEDMRSIIYFNGVQWVHEYQDACVDKVERFIRGEINNGLGAQSNLSTQTSFQRLTIGNNYASTPSIVATPSITTFPSGSSSAYSTRPPTLESEYHPLQFASQYAQNGSIGKRST